MKVAIIGAGAVGCWYGSLLTRHGHDVTLVARGAQLEALQQAPLKVQSALLGEIEVSLRAVSGDASNARPVDVVFVAVKSYHVASTLPIVRAWAGPDTPIITMQNGVDAPAQIAATLDNQPVWPGCVYILASLPTPGQLVQAVGPNRFVFGAHGEAPSARMTAVAEALTAAGIPAEATPRILSSLWEKFGIIVGWNGALSVARQPLGAFYADPVMLEFLRDAIAESHAVGRARGIELAPDLADKQIEFMSKFPPDSLGSMALDLAAGRPLELEALNGAVVRLGREARVPTPTNAAIYAALRPYADGAR